MADPFILVPLHASEGGMLALTNTSEVMKTAATTTLYALWIDNTQNTVASYVKIWAKAAPTVTTDAPVFVFRVAAGAARPILFGAGVVITNTTSTTVACFNSPGKTANTPPLEDVEVRWWTN